MNEKRQRCIGLQKKKLIELMTKHPELISFKVTQDFTFKDSQKLWRNIANQLNSLPGARKTWQQWKKTWQDLRSKTKKMQSDQNGEVPFSAMMLTSAEKEALGIKTISSTSGENTIESTGFVPPLQEFLLSDNEAESNGDLNALDSPPEIKVFTHKKRRKLKEFEVEKSSNHSDNCYFNCDMIAAQEHRKTQLKEDYLNFKKDYLRQKLQLMKEQTEALKSIAKELGSYK